MTKKDLGSDTPDEASSSSPSVAAHLLQVKQQIALALASQPCNQFFPILASELRQLTPISEVVIAAVVPHQPQLLKIIYQLPGEETHLPCCFELSSSPFIKQGQLLLIDKQFSESFPDYAQQLRADAAAFYSVSLQDKHQQTIGYIGFHYLQPSAEVEIETALIQAFQPRISTELVRYLDDAALRLANVAFEAREGIVITDTQYRVERVNRAFSRITGYSEAQVHGQAISEVFAGIEQELFNEAAQLKHREGEFYRQHFDGHRYPQLETLTAVFDGQDEVTHYVLCIEDISARKETERQIEQMAFYDELTGLLNRRKLFEELELAFRQAQSHEHIGALLFIDLDHFKNINDSLGHAVGDWLLKQVASRLKSMVRQGDLLARLGGDEFVLLLPNLGSNPPQAEQQAHIIGQRLIDDVSAPYCFEGQSLHIGASVGIGLFPERGQQPEDLLKQADTAMYQAKSTGRRTLMFFEPQMQEDANNRLMLNNALRDALLNDELELHYQPQHLVGSGELVGVEALVRWRPQSDELVYPNEFIPIAEETDLIIDIGLWVLREGCRQFKVWAGQGLNVASLSVNVSAKQFHDDEFVYKVSEVLSDTEMDPARLNLELTETVVIARAEEAIDKMAQLKAMGISFSIDDFGAGHSSLAYLKRLPIDELKIDRSFIRDIPSDPRDMAIVEAVLAMASHLGFSVMAVGVETRPQLDFLRQRSCTFYQGYLASKPLTAENIVNYIRRSKVI